MSEARKHALRGAEAAPIRGGETPPRRRYAVSRAVAAQITGLPEHMILTRARSEGVAVREHARERSAAATAEAAPGSETTIETTES